MAHVRFQLPIKGIFKGGSVEIGSLLTSGFMLNCRARDVLENRVRIGQRPGLDKWGDGDQIGAAEQPVVAIISISSVA